MNATRSGITCLGSVVVDLTKTVPEYPAPNRMTVIDEVVASTGGPGMNMAVDLRMLGADYPVALVGAIGDDQNGDLIRSVCEELGIDGSGLDVVSGVATSFTDVMVEPSGRRTMFHHPGSSHLLAPAMIDVDTMGSRILHVGSPGIHAGMDAPVDGADGPSGWVELLATARSAGMQTNMELVDLPPDRQVEMVGPCLPFLDSVVINELEAGTLTGIEVIAPEADGPIDWPAFEAMATGLIEAGVARLAVVHFPGGCVAAAPGGGIWRQGSVRLPADEVRSAVGAGDAFAAGVLHGLHQDWEVERCLALAVAVAAASVRGLTTSDMIEPVDACLALAARHGHRPTGR